MEHQLAPGLILFSSCNLIVELSSFISNYRIPPHPNPLSKDSSFTKTNIYFYIIYVIITITIITLTGTYNVLVFLH